MCDYIYPGTGETTVYCPRTSQFWVQATVTTHNANACPHHLARIVREIEEASKLAIIQLQKDGEDVPRSWFRWVKKDGQLYPRLFPAEAHNWAYITVKPYTRKAGK